MIHSLPVHCVVNLVDKRFMMDAGMSHRASVRTLEHGARQGRVRQNKLLYVCVRTCPYMDVGTTMLGEVFLIRGLCPLSN